MGICADALYRSDLDCPPLPEDTFKELMLFATRGVEFSFNNLRYKQIDGVAMGSPLGPALANKTLVHRAPMICSKNKLGSELDTIKRILIENGYPENVTSACIREKVATFVSNKRFGSEKCPVYLRIPWIGDISLNYENQIKKAINFCFYTVNPRVVYNTRVILPSIQKDCVPTHQKVCLFMNFPADVKLGM